MAEICRNKVSEAFAPTMTLVTTSMVVVVTQQKWGNYGAEKIITLKR